MSKRNLYLAALLIEVIAWANGAESGVIATIALAVIFLASLKLSPRDRHTGFRSCKGTGELHGWLFRHAFRKCPRCNGGRRIRLAARHLGTPPIRAEAEAGRRARATARKERTWR